MHIKLLKENITNVNADLYVVPTNTKLEFAGDVGRAVLNAAGKSKLSAACEQIGGCSVGHAVVAPGFKSKARYIVYTVAPDFGDELLESDELLASCYKEILKLAMSVDCHIIAMPLLGVGDNKYPSGKACEIAIKTIKEVHEAYLGYDFSIYFVDKSQKLIDEIKPMIDKFMEERKFHPEHGVVCFGNSNSDNEVFNSLYPCSFEVEGIVYESVAQYIASRKSLLFDDVIAFNQIMMSSASQMSVQTIGRTIRHFDQRIWDKYKFEIAYNGTLAKFSQNEELKAYLLATGTCLLAETEALEGGWGIGLLDGDPDIAYQEKWKGENLSGQVLMKVREKLKEE